MSFVVRLRTQAERDLERAMGWYERQRYGLGQMFLSEFAALKNLLEEAPLQYPLVYREVRRALFKRFPFGAFFQVQDMTVVVLAIMHASRDPDTWQRRN